MKRKLILTDADGVLVNWNDAFTKFMVSRGFPLIDDNAYTIGERFGIDKPSADRYVQDFSNQEEVGELLASADAIEYVGKLALLGFRFVVVTCIGVTQYVKQRREKNLINLYTGVFDEVMCLPMATNKEEVLKSRWGDSGLFWIEDHPGQAEAGLNAGLKPILIRQPYNDHYETDKFPIVSTTTPWKEIYDIILQDYGIDS